MSESAPDREASSSSPRYLYVGSWQKTLGGNDGSGGVTAFAVNSGDGSITPIGRYAENLAVGSMAVARRKGVLYAVNETKLHGEAGVGGSVSAFAIDPRSGQLTLLNIEHSVGVFPCSISIDSSESWLVIANYGSEDCVVASSVGDDGRYRLARVADEASVALMPIDKGGRLGPVCDVVKHSHVSGVDPVWQIAPHPHGVAFDPTGHFVATCDRGGDTVTIYRLDRPAGRLLRADEWAAAAGSGPRSLRFSPTQPYLYVSSELTARVTSYSFNSRDGSISEIISASTTPPNYRPRDPNDFFSGTHPSDLAVHPNERFVYVLNRGHNSIACFAVDQRTGRLTFSGTTPAEGTDPWTLCLDPDGGHLYVGNQGAGTLLAYDVTSTSGRLAPTGFVEYASKPASMAWYDV